jgi:hypothetical protein
MVRRSGVIIDAMQVSADGKVAKRMLLQTHGHPQTAKQNLWYSLAGF